MRQKVPMLIEWLEERWKDYERTLKDPTLPTDTKKVVGSWLNELEHIIPKVKADSEVRDKELAKQLRGCEIFGAPPYDRSSLGFGAWKIWGIIKALEAGTQERTEP